MSYKSKRPKITTTVELNLGSLCLLATPHEGHFPKPLARTSVLQMPWEMLKMQPAGWQVHLAYSIFPETPPCLSRPQGAAVRAAVPKSKGGAHRTSKSPPERGEGFSQLGTHSMAGRKEAPILQHHSGRRRIVKQSSFKVFICILAPSPLRETLDSQQGRYQPGDAAVGALWLH